MSEKLRTDEVMENGRALYRYVVLWTCVWVAGGLVNLFGLTRTVVTEQAKIGIKPFMAATAIPWLAAGFVACAVLGLAVLSKVTLTPRKSDLILMTMALALAAFTGFVVYDSVTAKLTCGEIILPSKPVE